MSKEKFREVVEKFYAEFGMENPDPTYETCQLAVDNTNFTLVHSERDNDYLISFCEYGAVPAMQSTQVLARLLEANMLSFGTNTPHFALNSETGSVIFIAQIPLSDLTVERLVETLKIFADGASEWRSTYFLENPFEEEEELAEPVQAR